ncbi:MAG: putative Ig domain-containing protein, partial [Blastocatellia bacterium]
MFGNPITCISALDVDLRSVLVQPGPTTAFGDGLIAGPILGTMHYGATACSLSFLDISGANADIKTAAKGGMLYTLGLATSESPGALSFVFGPILEITYLDQTISPSSLPGATVGVPYSVTLSTAAGSPTYSTSGFPASITVSGNKLAGTPTAPGTFSVSVTATDGATECTNTINYTFVVSCATTLSPSTLASGTAGTPYSVTFSGASGSPQWTATGLPTGLSMGLTTGILSGTPTQSGTFTVSVDAKDASIGCEIKTNYTLVIACQTITVTVPTIAAGTAGVAYTPVTFTQSGGIGTSTFSETGTLPTGMSLSTSGVLSGTPTKTGTFNFSVIATDSNGCTGSNTATITINCPTIVVTAPTISAGTAGVVYTPVTFTEAAGVGTITFTEAGALPTGMTLSTGGVFSGTPTQTGTFPFTVTATDSNGCTGTTSASITINCPTITVNPTTISSGTAGVAYSGAFSQTAGVGTVTFSESGTLPTGVTFSGNALTGTPTQTGSFDISVTATDSNACTGSRNYTLVINCPTITVGPASIPQGTAGVA